MNEGKVGRPPKEIDWEFVDKLLLAQNTAAEVASKIHINCHTFYEKIKEKYNMNFTDYAQIKYAEGRTNLKLISYTKALGGSIPMLLKLSEIYLDEFKDNKHNLKPANQDEIDKDQLIMRLQHEIEELKKQKENV